jgi:hypothetical protein
MAELDREEQKYGRRLQAGERFRMAQDGSVGLWEVVRTTPCAAYCWELWARPRTVTLTDKHGVERSFQATHGAGIVAISLHSAVERVQA